MVMDLKSVTYNLSLNMDILDFSEEIKNFRHNGMTLNLDERMQLEGALNILQTKNDDEELTFWGKISGIKNDYYIAMAIQYRDMYEFPVKKFYWALSNDFTFREMPSLTEQHDVVININNSYFIGDPARMLVSSKKEGDDEEAKEEEANPEGEDREEGKAKKEDSDISEEEEIKVPQRDLTGKCLIDAK